MGWADCGTDERGRPIGYAFEAECDWPGCRTRIDRGLSYVCGRTHLDGESCNGYFCGAHRTPVDGLEWDLCLDCADEEVVREVMES